MVGQEIKLLFPQQSYRSSHSWGLVSAYLFISLNRVTGQVFWPHPPHRVPEWGGTCWLHLAVELVLWNETHMKGVHAPLLPFTIVIPCEAWSFLDVLSRSSRMMVDSTICKHVPLYQYTTEHSTSVPIITSPSACKYLLGHVWLLLFVLYQLQDRK